MPSFISDRRLFLTADKNRVVEEGDPEAAFLLASEGSEVPADEAERLGLSKSGQQPATERGSAGPESAEPGDAGAGAEAPGGAKAHRPHATDKAVRGPKE